MQVKSSLLFSSKYVADKTFEESWPSLFNYCMDKDYGFADTVILASEKRMLCLPQNRLKFYSLNFYSLSSDQNMKMVRATKGVYMDIEQKYVHYQLSI